jgi:hypothetical protein
MMETTGSMPQHNCKHYDGALLTTCVHSTVQTYQQEHLHLQLNNSGPKTNWLFPQLDHVPVQPSNRQLPLSQSN